ncbi:MAG: hypothetical protein K2K96_05765 [Lachnospiraceae bacterium]|nr:hypothetical protein [Lachnospiraceae bacterium]
MKKHYLALMAAAILSMAVALSGCSGTENPASDGTGTDATNETETDRNDVGDASGNTETSPEEGSANDVNNANGVMTYAEYMAADLDTPVVVETYVQAKQAWWEDKATIYTQDEDGAYFIYEMACSEEDYEKLTVGTKIRVTGFKGEWSGEIEIMDATFEIIDGNFVAEPLDVTDILGVEDELIAHQNELVSFTDMTVEDAGNGEAFMYNWDNSGTDGDDLYFNVSANGETYSFVVESYLCDNTTDVYAAVKNLQIGDVVSMEGFLYWYNGANPHITSITVR